MGKIDGFLTIERETPAKEAVSERKKHYNEFQSLPSTEALNKQSARCMDCGIPFCMSGCPLGNIIPEFNDAVYNKQWETAYHILKSTNNFPEFTGRICPAPCEGACVLGINEDPVTIEEIEKNIIEIAYQNNWVRPNYPVVQQDKTVAVIGSGPAGLAAADQLNQLGYQVTVFERQAKIGGLLRYGIPDFKLEKNVVDRRLELMKNEGVVFKTNIEVGVDYSAEDLKRNFDAIVLATGSTVPRDLPIKNRDAQGVYFAMDYLKQSNEFVDGLKSLEIDAKDKNVIVIGGGDTGSDCIGTANRQGAKSITQLEIMPKPPKHRDASMPWPQYPMTLKITSSHEEGCERQWSVNAKEFVVNEHHQLTGIRLVNIEWKKDKLTNKYLSFEEVLNSERVLECDLVFLAMGFLHVEQGKLVSSLGINLDPRGNLIGNDTEYKTNQPKIFSCGDARRGQSLVVWAIQEGRDCADKVHQFLSEV
jgi:glutamate synthase (NADPH/NADH) small chain